MNEVLTGVAAAAEAESGSPGLDALLARVAAAGPVVEAEAPKSDKAGRLTDRAMDALHDQGLFRLLLPRDLGGSEITLPQFFAVMQAVASYDASAAWCMGQGNGCAMMGAYLGESAAREIWADQPRAVLAWGPGKAEAVAVDGGYRVTARSSFVSGSRHATWFGAHCSTVREKDGSIRLSADGKPENRTAILPAAEATMIDNWDVVGLRATGSDSFAVNDLFVPEERTIPRATMIPGRRTRSPLYIFAQTAIYSVAFSATALGIARGFLDAFLVLAQEKKPRLVTVPIRDNPVVQDEVARAEARLSGARAFVAAEVERGWRESAANDAVTIEQRMRMRLATTHAIHEAKAVVDTLFDTSGTSAIFASTPFERRFRDIHAVALQIQGRKTHFATVGSWLLGHPADMISM